MFLWDGSFFTERGSITYNRAGGVIPYNTTSDYRAKDIIGPVIDSGALIDSTPVYMGKMKMQRKNAQCSSLMKLQPTRILVKKMP